jgi:transglutaminase-like putative cysteine protease
MKSILLFVVCLISFHTNAQNYDVALISDSLKQNADAVLRYDLTKVVIKSPSHAVVTHSYAITILNEAGDHLAVYQNSYDKLFSLESIDGTLYDAQGKKLKSVKKKDISDFSAYGDGSLMSDDRYKRHSFYYTQYPYTIAYEDEQDLHTTFSLPSWHPIDLRCSVQRSNFVLEAPADYAVRFKQVAYTPAPVKTNIKDYISYSWELKNYKAIDNEPMQPGWQEINPAVYLAPSQFELKNFKGEMTSWKTFGDFMNLLNKDRQTLPDNVKSDIHILTDKLTDDKLKIDKVYEYMQKNTRYISVQIGIGGWQPFDATYVAQKKYGDCKALSNYMMSLLKEANIPARYVLINAGKSHRNMWEDFSANLFNHAIICVPLKKDSVWLECTSQTVSAGYMGTFTGNRRALLMDENGGHVVNTPAYTAAQNLQIRNVTAEINDVGDLHAKVYTHFTGIQQETVHGLMYETTADEKKNYLNSMLSLPTYSVEASRYKEKKGGVPEVDEYLEVTSPFYATITGKRLFVTPNFFNRTSTKLPDNDVRKYDIKFSIPFIDIDSINVTIPPDYTLEAMPADVVKTSPYGKYSISFKLKDNVLSVVRKNESPEKTFPRSEYNQILEYFKTIYKADRSRIVLVKKV